MPLSFPANPTLNQTYVYSGVTWTFNGNGWTKSTGTTGSGGGGATVTVANTAPSSPTEGALWVDSDYGDLNAYFSNAWAIVGGGGSIGGGNLSVTQITAQTGSLPITGNVILNGSYLVLPTGASRPNVAPDGSLRITSNTTSNVQTLEVYNVSSSKWVSIKNVYEAVNGLTTTSAGLSANDLMLRNGYTSANNGLYYITNYGSIQPTQHYCLFDTTYAGGGWTLLMTQTSGNNFAAGTNYAFSVTVGTPSRSAAYGLDRRNTFIPQAGDEFLIIREATGEWVRFVVTTWSPTSNNVANRWETLNNPAGSNMSHPYWAVGQTYGSNGVALSGFIHFNGCAIGGNCGSGGGDGAGFGNHESWLYGAGGSSAYGGGFNGATNGGSPLYWGTTSVEGTALTYWFRRPNT